MNFQERKQIILSEVEEKGSVGVKDLAELLDTSEITVRRDLATLSEKGLVFRTHGGAMKVGLSKDKFSFANKTATNAEQKDYICQIAAQQIKENDIVFIDCGSTLFRLCSFVKNMNIKVITNSLPVVYELLDSEVSVNLIGGEVDFSRMAVHGYFAEEHIARYQANKAFIGVDGISLANGLSAFGEKEAAIAKAMAANSDEVFLLCDSSKLEKDKYLKFAPITMINTLVTDKEADENILKFYRKIGLKIIN